MHASAGWCGGSPPCLPGASPNCSWSAGGPSFRQRSVARQPPCWPPAGGGQRARRSSRQAYASLPNPAASSGKGQRGHWAYISLRSWHRYVMPRLVQPTQAAPGPTSARRHPQEQKQQQRSSGQAHLCAAGPAVPAARPGAAAPAASAPPPGRGTAPAPPACGPAAGCRPGPGAAGPARRAAPASRAARPAPLREGARSG